jgi:3-methylcrotonyl-CoA carboxylase alpha subunit
LSQFVLLGITTNCEYLQAVLAHPAFRQGDLSTAFVPEHMADWVADAVTLPDAALAAVRLHELVGNARGGSNAAAIQEIETPWDSLSGWRQNQNGDA